MSKKIDPTTFYTISVSDEWKNLDWSKLTLDNSINYSVTYTVSSDPIYDYDRVDAQFDALEDQTGVAKEMLAKIGIKVK